MNDFDRISEGGPWPIVIRPGRSFSRTFWLYESDGATRIPLNGWSGKAQVRDAEGRLLVEMTVVVSQVITLSDPTCGQVTVSATTAATAPMSVPGEWDLILYRGSGASLETRELVSRSDALLGTGVTRL